MSDARSAAPGSPLSPLACVLYGMLGVYAACLLGRYIATAPTLCPDGFGQWSFGRFVASNPPVRIYDPSALMTFQLQLGLDDPSSFYPFGYPPPFLLLVAPLGYLSYPAAAALWAAGTLAVLLVAFIRPGQPRHLLLLLLVAPTTIICLVFGQNGCLFAGILLGGLRLSERRPRLGGLVLGAMICKPQLGLLLPVALLALGRWRTIVAAGLSAIGLMGLSALIFGPALVLAWPAASVTFVGVYRAGSTHLWPMMPTLTGLMLQLGASTRWMTALQAVATVVAVVLTWRAYRSANPAAVAVLAAATFLASPYALVYDMVLVTAASLWVLPDTPLRLPTAKIALLAVVLCAPMLMLNGWPAGLIGLFAALVLAHWIGQETAPAACRDAFKRVSDGDALGRSPA